MNRTRKIFIAQMLLATSHSEASKLQHVNDTEDGYIYSFTAKNGKTVTVRIKQGGTIQIKDGDDWRSLDLHVPFDIVTMQEFNMKDFHKSLMGWLGDSEAFVEQAY